MVGKKGPGIAGGFGFNENYFQPVKKVNTISFIPKNILTFDSATDDVMYGAGRIDTGFSRHKKAITGLSQKRNS
ncbi:MAG: hypothetical protein ACWGNO_12690 [Desulfobacterales bacterium]